MKIAELLVEKAVTSTWISNLTYNRPNRILTMRLSNGRAYKIANVSRYLFDLWHKSESKGKFFHKRIRNECDIQRIA